MRAILAVCGLLLPVAQTNASGGELIAEQAAYDVEHYTLALRVDPRRRRIDGSLVMRARVVAPTQQLALDLDDRLEVGAVWRGDVEVPFEHRDGRIWIDAPIEAAGETVAVKVDYGGVPRVAPRPPWDGGFTWEKTRAGQPWIATSCQGEGADLWWPCKDHPSDKADTMDLEITVPKGLVCAANGTLQEERPHDDGTHTYCWHIANPINNYCVALNIAPYRVLERSYESVAGDAVPVYFWVLPENLGKGRKILPQFLDHLRHLEEVCGPYPFRNEKYGIVETPHLGMEHQTIIAYGNKFRRGPFNYDWLHHHELAHEWWANLVTCRDWKDMWLHEGFATYMQALYVERSHGAKGYRTFMAGKRRGLRNRRAVAPREVRDSKQIYFGADGGHDNDIYDKGAAILHTLRWVLGEDTFFKVLRRFAYPEEALEQVTNGSQVRFADTEDFRAVAEAISGQDLEWFFAVYLRQPDLPMLEVEQVGRELRLAWRAPRDLPFPMPVAIRQGRQLERVDMPDGKAVVRLRSKKFEVDPDDWVLRR